MNWKIIIPILVVFVVFASGCTSTLNGENVGDVDSSGTSGDLESETNTVVTPDLSLSVTNPGNSPVSLVAGDVTLLIEDEYGSDVCSSRTLDSEYGKCVSGCVGTLAPDETTTLGLKLSECSEFNSGSMYYYKLEFKDGMIITGTFVY